MALPSETFQLFVTHVVGEGKLLKISGQTDKSPVVIIESLFKSALENLEKGIGAVSPIAIQEGIICAAKYKDGVYYRAKIINITSISTGLVGVHFIDYGNKDIISLSTIRFLDNYDPMFLQFPGQATDYYLSRLIHPSGKWEEPLLLKLRSLLCYAEYPATIEAQPPTLPVISIKFNGCDLSSYLASNKFGVALPLAKQEILLMQLCENQQIKWQPSLMNETSYIEHVPFFVNQSFASNPASAMRLQQNVALPFNGSMPLPSAVSQRLLVNRTSRSPLNLIDPIRQTQVVTSQPLTATPPTTMPLNKASSPKKSITYKSRLLEINSRHNVYISFAEDGPELFAIQLVTEANKLREMMDNINIRPLSSLAEPPMIGTMCLGRMSGDRVICRAIVTNLSGSQCKLFFVDFGATEMVSYYDIFDIPEEFVKPNVFAMRFCLSGIKKLEKGPNLNRAFMQLVTGQVMTLKVVPPEGPPLIQYGELYMENVSVIDLLANVKDNLQFEWIEKLPVGSRHSVLVSYVDNCINFFVQLSDMIDELNAVMNAVRLHCVSSASPGKLLAGCACCARFPDDGNWYRAIVRGTKGDKVVVTYVDYGNEQEIEVSDLRTITPELIRLPAQAMKCALKGFENKPMESKTSNQLEMLALEKTLMAHIIGMLSNDTMLISLVDDTVNPPLDVARRMTQLSQPRSNIEIKATTPVRKDAPESFSSPESTPDDGRRKSFRREKSFKEDRRTSRENEDFGQRGSSFRNRENKDGFDRSGPGRYSDKFAGRPDRTERRGGPKPWETSTTPPAVAASDDSWDDPSSTSSPNKPIRDKRKLKSEDRPGPRPGWKNKDSSGVGKRLRQAAEAASLDSQNPPRGIQDRLKRDRFKPNERDERRDDWGNRTGRDNRPDRREGRPERRDNWGDKKDNWNQRRDFRDRNERGDRGDRPSRSNFTPRDRVERFDRSFGSDADKSDRRTRPQDGGKGGPYKPRSKFTVLDKELPNPSPLDTPFLEMPIELGAQHEVAVTWIISPDSFHTQILSYQPKFLEMMHNIPELYKGVKPYQGNISVGATVLARYPADRVLYRATVESIQPFSKFVVRYVDFGNKHLVDANDIWQMDSSLMELPKMAVHCSLVGVIPKDGEWKTNPDIDLCFNAPRYQCVFQDNVDGQYKVSLWNNGTNAADMLVEKELAILSEEQSSVTLKDEAIDLTIIVGQQILCKVTHVESFEKFYVQLDMDKAKLVESAIESFDASLLTPLSVDSMADGNHCTLKHDGKIYRAILTDVSDAGSVKAVLPDIGKTITTTGDNLMILPTELTVYYYQSLECCLNNYTADSKQLMTIDALKERLIGNNVIVYINDVADITLVTTLYDPITGKKIAVFEPDDGAYDEVVPLCTRAVFNYNFGLAYISHAQNLNEIYVQNVVDTNRIAALLDELYRFYEEGTSEPLTSFETDELCAAKSSDGNWYRATVISAEDDNVKVHFTDYGNMEVVSKEVTKKLDSKFYEPCALALVASLGLVALQDDAVQKLTEWTMEKDIQVTLAFGTDGWLASFHLDGVDLSMRLVNEKLATPQIITTDEIKTDAAVEEPISIPEGCTQVYISHIDSPGQFWLQMSDKIDKIEEIQAELQSNVGSYEDIDSRDMGTLCIAKYSADDQWYRAEILDSDSDITTVRFIDYGNTDVLDNQPGLLKAMPENLKTIERYALKSSVNAVPTGTGQWSEPASDYFMQLVGDFSTPVDALIVLKDVTTYVDIFVNGQHLTDKLVSEGHATKSEEPECGSLPSCFASHVNTPSEFWIQLETAAPELQAMEAAMYDAENFPELTDKEEGVICAAKYPEDGAWYRAQVIVDGSEGTEVLFMDYGNASIATELRSLPEELKIKPALSRKCALQKTRNIKSWSRKSEIKFNELAAEGATIFNVQFIASGDISIVELYLEGKSVTEELVSLCEETPPTERPTPVGQDLHSTGKICFVSSLDEFYVQLDDSVPELDKISEALVKSPEFESISELKVGSICSAFWTEYEQWYRAKVLEFCDVGCHIQFIDFGNKAKCEDFKQLPEKLASIDPIAKCCRLAGIDVANDCAKRKLEEAAADASSTFQIEFLDSTKEPILVRLTLNGEDVSTLITTTVAQTEIETVTEELIESVNESKELTTKELSQNVIDNTKSDNVCAKDEPDVLTTEFSTDLVTNVTESSDDVDTTRDQETAVGVEESGEAVIENLDSTLNDFSDALDSSLLDFSDTDKNHTIIENKSFEKASSEEVLLSPNSGENTSTGTLQNSDTIKNPEVDDSKETISKTPERDDSKETISKTPERDDSKETISKTPERDDSKETISKTPEQDNSKETISKTPERDDSKESVATDTGYISNGEKSAKDNISDEKNIKTSEVDEKMKQETETEVMAKDCVIKPLEATEKI